MKNHKKKVLIILCLVCCIITIYEIVRVYAVFHSELFGTLSTDIAKWHILVNGTDIVSTTTQEFVIDTLSTIENGHMAENKFAPSAEGSFEITIEPLDTQVSVRYDISINQLDITNQKIILSLVEEIDTGSILIRTGENTYTGIIPLEDIVEDYVNNIKITFIWENDETNNAQDIILGTTPNLKVQIPISVTISQYMGEEVVPY